MTTDRTIARALADALDADVPVAMATVVRTERSVPRHAGAKMLVFGDGRQLGTIGGGEMESRVRAAAADALATGRPTTLEFDLVDPAHGDPGVCGGSAFIYLEPYMPREHVVVIGCGHVGAAVVELAHWLGFRVTALDDRADVADAASLPDADVVLAGPLAESLRQVIIDESTHAVLVTRNVAVDVEVLPIVLGSPARSIGVMGSSRRWATTRAALAETGVADERLDAVHAPIGLDVDAETPAEIALSIMSQIVGLRHPAPAEQEW
ncbi:XdhC family protein [Ilumatobacter sp.]|uniref:XdhC family protein n=1 Tax=Ilumatobacter sp. TaxID=1967498 RepID=UPI003AF75467